MTEMQQWRRALKDAERLGSGNHVPLEGFSEKGGGGAETYCIADLVHDESKAMLCHILARLYH